MFKASIQRQVRLSSVARQFSSASLTRSTQSQHLAILRQTASQPALRHLAPRCALFRLYSAESDAAQANRSDEFAPVESAPVTRFTELSQLGVNEALIEALTRGMGYDAMTEVQAMTINPALKGSDMVAQAKTGTGKTLAFLVPLFQRVLQDQPELADRFAFRRASSEDIRAIILSPTRELAEQIGAEARKLAKNTGIVVQTAVGGTRKREALYQMRRQGCDILVATPGRLNDLLSDPDARVAAPNLQAFVLDEADRMLDVGFADELHSIQDNLPDTRASERQTLLFSATIPKNVVQLARTMVRPHKFEFVQTIKADEEPTHQRVPQHLVTVDGLENVFPAIMEIAHKAKTAEESDLPFKAMVFFSNTAAVQFAHEVFRQTPLSNRGSGTSLYQIHSRLSQGQRTQAANSFREARSAILFTSDVTARGMDFPNVTDVIQVGLPPDRDQYIHRVGRTGRAGNSGKGWLILTNEEIPEARYRLPGLPIKPNDTLETAKHVIGESAASDDVSRFFGQIKEAYERVDRQSFTDAYMAYLGQKFGRNFSISEFITLLNRWCLQGMGWEKTPGIPPKIARNRGLDRVAGARIAHESERNNERDYSRNPFESDRRGGQGGRGDFGNSFRRADSHKSGYSRGRTDGLRHSGQRYERSGRSERSSFGSSSSFF
ncbi:DEAD-domain-containing protein [Xylaria palmicola]|nr:DEAD-domain-containing protein [Xylaria palmicola]